MQNRIWEPVGQFLNRPRCEWRGLRLKSLVFSFVIVGLYGT